MKNYFEEIDKKLKEQIKIEELKIAIIGLGYVGLPLALAFEKKRSVIGFDIEK